MHAWILIADGAIAKLLSASRWNGPYHVEKIIENAPGRARPQEMTSDVPGRYSNGGLRGMRSAFEPSTGADEVELRRFARQLAGTLQKGLEEGKYDALAVLVPPRLLGRLRMAMGPQVQKQVAAWVAKDLTPIENSALPELLNTTLTDALHPSQFAR